MRIKRFASRSERDLSNLTHRGTQTQRDELETGLEECVLLLEELQHFKPESKLGPNKVIVSFHISSIQWHRIFLRYVTSHVYNSSILWRPMSAQRYPDNVSNLFLAIHDFANPFGIDGKFMDPFLPLLAAVAMMMMTVGWTKGFL